MKLSVFAFVFFLAASSLAAQLPDSTRVIDLAKGLNEGKIALALKIKPTNQIQKALNAYNLFLNIRSQGRPITTKVLVNARTNPEFRFVIADGQLLSVPELVARENYDHYSYVSINVSPGISPKELVMIPKVAAGSVIAVKQLTFEDRVSRDNLLFLLEDSPVTLSMHGWLHATLGDLRNALKNAAEVFVEIR